MASTSAVPVAMMPTASPATRRALGSPSLSLAPRSVSTTRSTPRRIEVRASASGLNKEQAVAGLTAAALAAALVVPEIAEAAQPGLSPSLKNFLLSIVSGGVVLGAIVGAVIGVSNFDPVKRT